MNGSPIIAVYGSSSIPLDSPSAKQAETLGKQLAEAGYSICNGGYSGVMEACSRGAFTAGGEVIGVTCSAFAGRKPNPYLTQEIKTQDLPERISTLMRIAEGYIVLDGSAGTLAELFLAWNLLIMGETKPLIVVGEPLRQVLQAVLQHTEVTEPLMDALIRVDTVDEALEKIRERLPV